MVRSFIIPGPEHQNSQIGRRPSRSNKYSGFHAAFLRLRGKLNLLRVSAIKIIDVRGTGYLQIE